MTSASEGSDLATRPYNLIAELTYRCPLRCPYCSNPLELDRFPAALSTEDWCRVLREAAELGVVHVGLTGGEPSLRTDLEPIVAEASARSLYTHLVTAGFPIDHERLAGLKEQGLCSVQLSVQDSDPAESDRIAGAKSFPKKRAFAEAARALDLPLILNVVLHRQNLHHVAEVIALADEFGAHRLELANTQYHGWALKNRAALLPSESQLREAAKTVRELRPEYPNLEILFVLPDYYSDRPKPCMGGWGRNTMVVTPNGQVLPCHNASELPELEFWSVNEHPLAACWSEAPGMNAFRGEDWMREPCRSCPDRERDFGGCRCQAFALTGDARATDPACSLSPHRSIILEARDEPADDAFVYRAPARGRGKSEVNP